MGYSIDDNHVRVDFFTAKGEHWGTKAVNWPPECQGGTGDGRYLPLALSTAFARVLRVALKDDPIYNDMIAVCIKHPHVTQCPVMGRVTNLTKTAL